MTENASELRPTRRRFFQIVAGLTQAAIGLLVGIPVVGYLLDPLRRREGQAEWFPVGGAGGFEAGRPRPVGIERVKGDGYVKRKVREVVWVVRTNDGFTAFSGSCTHLGCNVAWNPGSESFDCPCHGGKFSRCGKVVGGPPIRPLDQLETRVANGVLEVRLARA